ncbi:uncharacterized protein LOC123313800 isoform X1 [Coccinella septempunctata]|uniref:uncharacterized protein LOC123313800 isoform X1 n=1 Tax=Coccinella septempunctata TaxID=41139 RepID=UPI001D070C1C|nr:uncharacterized protein LOC123313800 isoform X1 [Coccinella septempunctata]XP_044754758.1 uncharacterized protein LOC123313800 isoform X1 [Coccinella septempunctata]
MEEIFKPIRGVLLMICVTCCFTSIRTCTSGPQHDLQESSLHRDLKGYIDKVFSIDDYYIMPGVSIEKASNDTDTEKVDVSCETQRKGRSLQDYLEERLDQYTKTHVLSVRMPQTARLFFAQPEAGKSSFLAGFGMGFLAFALKKLLLPVFIGAQLLKSVMIAMFLPSIIGGLGKFLGKGLSTFSGISQASTGYSPHNQAAEEFEFKDTSPYNTNGDDGLEDFMPAGEASNTNVMSINVVTPATDATPSPNSRYGYSNKRIHYVAPQTNDNYYMRKPYKKADYKVFHKIPSSSLLLTSYDPFYSPLLSRLDAVFQQLGLGNDKSPKTELCRERLVCMMYANPAKYAPYSNLVSAQLSRELNELRKPASDNPEILRFFRYMKAAKDGQDGEECLAHGGCPSLGANQPSPAILTTFNDINKLVQARNLK